jgi:acyl carrier protein
MSIDLSSKSKLKPVFPAAELKACLQAELIQIVQSNAGMHGTALPGTPAAIVTTPFPIDSLDVVETLCKLDELVGFNIPHTVVRAGGYDSIGEAIQHVMPRVEKVWSKRNGDAA